MSNITIDVVLRHAEHHARNRTSLACLEQNLLFLVHPILQHALKKNQISEQKTTAETRRTY